LSVSERRRQRHNLQRLHGECELNYVRLLRLMPRMPQLGQSIDVDFTHECNSGMQVRIDEITRYTHLLSIVAESARPEWLPEIQIKVRIYHDAKMAEVVEWCSDRTIPWELAEKSSMQAPDEKWQWNMFLSDLLAHGLSHGMSKVKLSLQ
jgi:uncharacterized protein YqiB (DUF1249 family)